MFAINNILKMKTVNTQTHHFLIMFLHFTIIYAPKVTYANYLHGGDPI